MLKSIKLFVVFAAIAFSASFAGAATCDQYPGDSWIYGGAVSSIKPNVLIIIDTSGSMSGEVADAAAAEYASGTTYTASGKKCRDTSGEEVACSTNKVYKYNSSEKRWEDAGFSYTSASTSCPTSSINPRVLLSTTGKYAGRVLKTDGSCNTSSTSSATYALGNWINWDTGTTVGTSKIVIARSVVTDLIKTTFGVNFGVMVFNGGNGSKFFEYKADGTNLYTSTVKDMDAIYSGTMTNREALLKSINTTTITAAGTTPLAESLYEAGQYFRGGKTEFGNTVAVAANGKYTSPITSSCQKNYAILVTDGMSTADNAAILDTVIGNYDGDSHNELSEKSHYLDDVAKYLYDTDLLPDTGSDPLSTGHQNIVTFTIGFGLGSLEEGGNAGTNAAAIALLDSAANSTHGHGVSYNTNSQSGLSTALTQVMSSLLEIDISFVAPVVPVSPDNRTYNSSRIYMGFFKPVNNKGTWEGNLKKYGLDENINIIDRNGHPANWVDTNSDRVDDRTGETLPGGASNGSFRDSSVSYWSPVADAGNVTAGGVGDLLLLRDFATAPRKLYTYTGSNSDLTHATNLFSKTNTSITSTGSDTATTRTLGVTNDTEKNTLIDFIHGIDTATSTKREWIFGDILHSRPLVVNYATYTFTLPADKVNEGDCTKNKSVIYVGSNDGMLHALNDCDGSEAWSFIPPAVLKSLKDNTGTSHSYSVDSSPTVYIYDQNSNGNIEAGTDKVILLVGLRRGGGPITAPATGSYYALDVTNPALPKYLWTLSNSTPDFSELGESWGEPKIVKLKINGVVKLAAFIGAGYDNLNEDNRYGATQAFTNEATVSNSGGKDNTTSVPVVGPAVAQKGRGIYAFEVATLSNIGVPTIAAAPNRLWGVTYGASTAYNVVPATDSGMTYSFVSDVSTLDVDGNGYIDRLYVNDLGGNLWRFDVGDPAPSKWTGNKIFRANPGSVSTDTGRKFFYKPVASLETSISTASRGNDAIIFMGSGDREHPTNTAVIDRLYAVRDKGQTTASAKSESDLLDVTTDQLQTSSIANTSSNLATPTVGSADYYLKQLSTNYGWYIKLDRTKDSSNLNAGEKVLAAPTLSNKVVYFSTFTPGSSVSADPCKPSNLGTSRLYELNYATGEAVVNSCNINTNNICDSNTVTNTGLNNDTITPPNKRSKMGAYTLLRSDRVKTLGSGIASGVVLVRDKAFVGGGGTIVPVEIKKGGRIINLYWGQK